MSVGVHRAAARWHISTALQGRTWQGTRAPLQAQGGCPALARRGDGGTGDRRVRRPGRRRITFAAWFREWSDRQVWGRGTMLAARQAADSVTFAELPIRRIRASHVQQWVKAMSQPAAGRRSGWRPARSHSLQLRPHGPSGRRRRPDHQGGPVGRHRAAAAAQGLRCDDHPDRRGGGPRPRGRPRLVPAVHRRVRVRRAAVGGGSRAAARGRRLHPPDDCCPPSIAGATNDSTELVAPKFGSERAVYVPAQLIALLAEHVRRSGVRPGDWLIRKRSPPAQTATLPAISGGRPARPPASTATRCTISATSTPAASLHRAATW